MLVCIFVFFLDPTPPGPIVIGLQTNSSFHVNWATPAQMDGAPNIRFFVTYQSDTGDILKVNTTVNNAQLAQLFPGTIYNISVETAGPQNLRSTAVHNSASTCKFNKGEAKYLLPGEIKFYLALYAIYAGEQFLYYITCIHYK